MATKMIEQIFQMPLPEKTPNFDESIPPWKHVDSMKTGDVHSFTEIFAQLDHHHLHQDPPESSSSSLYTLSPSSSLSSEFSHDVHRPSDERKLHLLHRRSDSVSSCYSEHSSVCNDVVESSDDVDGPIKSEKCDQEDDEEVRHHRARREHETSRHSRRSRRKYGGFPPPMMPWLLLQSIRQDGRFILTKVRIPTQEFMHACREDGRLQLRFVQSDEEEEVEKEEYLHACRENGRLMLRFVQSEEEEERSRKN